MSTGETTPSSHLQTKRTHFDGGMATDLGTGVGAGLIPRAPEAGVAARDVSARNGAHFFDDVAKISQHRLVVCVRRERQVAFPLVVGLHAQRTGSQLNAH